MHIYTSIGSFSPSFIATNSLGLVVYGIGTAISTEFNSGLVANGSFGIGDFTDWVQSGDNSDTYVDNGSSSGITPYLGNYEAALGTSGSEGYLSQSISTTAGASYLLSFWLDNPFDDPCDFNVSWNGNTLLDTTTFDADNWTNLQFLVKATGVSTVLRFGFEDDQDVLGLDNISVVPEQPSINDIRVSGRNVVIDGSNGVSSLSCHVLMTTNLALPLSQWTVVATDNWTANGNFTLTVTNSLTSSIPKQFYILQVP